MNATDDMRPIKGFPGYFITRNGEIWSNKRSPQGKLHPVAVRDGFARLMKSPGRQVYRKVSDLIDRAYL